MLPSVAIAIDQILALQFALAWAGEGQCDPPRLGWWRTDLVNEYGGGDFMQRLAPRTHRWAALEAVRRAARLTDQRAHSHENVRTLYRWGFELEEQLDERIRELKWSQVPPEEALKLPISVLPTARFDRAALEQALGPQGDYTVQPGGRELKSPMPSDPAEAARCLAAAMLPLPASYPAPYYRL